MLKGLRRNWARFSKGQLLKLTTALLNASSTCFLALMPLDYCARHRKWCRLRTILFHLSEPSSALSSTLPLKDDVSIDAMWAGHTKPHYYIQIPRRNKLILFD